MVATNTDYSITHPNPFERSNKSRQPCVNDLRSYDIRKCRPAKCQAPRSERWGTAKANRADVTTGCAGEAMPPLRGNEAHNGVQVCGRVQG